MRAVARAEADAGNLQILVRGVRRRLRWRGRPRLDERRARWREFAESGEFQRRIDLVSRDGKPVSESERWSLLALEIWQRFPQDLNRNDYPAAKNDPDDIDRKFKRAVREVVKKALQNQEK